MSNQSQSCQALTVTLRDSHDQAVAGAAMQLRVGAAVQDAGELDAAGQAELCAPAGTVRVAVSGQLPSGVPLVLPGQDADGIQLRIGDAPARLHLRVEEDGMVLPDPLTMWAREPGPPVATLPATTLPATPAATLPALPILPPAAPTASVAVVTPATVPSRTPSDVPTDLLVSGALLILALLLVGGWWLWERRAA
ncbi:MAG TPA: hypothetical protein VFS21_35480 [Roseiflexaceae bacterium]|nr:hypothetical protein [Roseiflexaceae bacterium]